MRLNPRESASAVDPKPSRTTRSYTEAEKRVKLALNLFTRKPTPSLRLPFSSTPGLFYGHSRAADVSKIPCTSDIDVITTNVPFNSCPHYPLLSQCDMLLLLRSCLRLQFLDGRVASFLSILYCYYLIPIFGFDSTAGSRSWIFFFNTVLLMVWAFIIVTVIMYANLKVNEGLNLTVLYSRYVEFILFISVFQYASRYKDCLDARHFVLGRRIYGIGCIVRDSPSSRLTAPGGWVRRWLL